MMKIKQSPEDLAYVTAADKADCLPELCNFMDYHPDHGRVDGYWQPKYQHFVVLLHNAEVAQLRAQVSELETEMITRTIKFEFVDPDGCEEKLEIMLNGVLIATANHDDDGWGGMNKLRTTCEAIENYLKK